MIFRSAESGLELIKDAPTMNIRPSILKHLRTRHENVMRQFLQEVGVVELEFLKNRKTPPVGRNQPVRAGSVFWERLLYHHLKKSVIAFRRIESEPGVANSYLKRTAFAQYFALVTDMKAYEDDNFDQFLAAGTHIVNNCMKKNILKLEFSEIPIELETKPKAKKTVDDTLKKRRQSGFFGLGRHGSIVKGKFATMATAIQWLSNRPGIDDTNVQMAQKLLAASANVATKESSAREPDQFKIKQAKIMVTATKQERIPTWKDVIGDNVLMDYKLKFCTNFSHEVFDIISEGQEFEYLGFTVDPVIRLAIMKKDILFRDVEAVQNMVDEYNRIVSNLSIGEINFLKDTIYKVETLMQAGLGRYTWQSFNITKYCEKCSELLKTLAAMVLQIGHVENDIRNRIKKIETYNLFAIEFKTSSNIGGDEMRPPFDIITPRRASEVKRLRSMRKTVDVNLNKTKRKSVKVKINYDIIDCREFFKQLHTVRDEKCHRIKKMYDSIGPILIKLESLILETFTGQSEKMELYYNFWERETFNCATRVATDNLSLFEKQLQGNVPIFQVDAILATPNISLRPTTTEIYNIMIHSMKDFLKRAHIFTRWMNGTCLPCPAQKIQDNIYVASFFEDLIQLPEICDIVRSIQTTVQNLVKDLQTYLQRYVKNIDLYKFNLIFITYCFNSGGINIEISGCMTKILFGRNILIKEFLWLNWMKSFYFTHKLLMI